MDFIDNHYWLLSMTTPLAEGRIESHSESDVPLGTYPVALHLVLSIWTVPNEHFPMVDNS